MKYLLLIPLLLLGCDNGTPITPSGPAVKYQTPSGVPNMWKVNIEGHDYLGFHITEGGGGLTHAESCQCRRQ